MVVIEDERFLRLVGENGEIRLFPLSSEQPSTE